MALYTCTDCGKEISETATCCPNCGARNKYNTDKSSFGLKVVCFFLPIIGFLIFAINIPIRPKYAKGCLIASILPLAILLGLILVGVIISVIMSASVFNRVNSYSSYSSYDDDYLPYCKYSTCYNRVEYSWLDYCEDHSYLEY